MVALVQRVSEASVVVDGDTRGAIDAGLLILLGVHKDDTHEESAWLARKCANLRIFADDDGQMNRSVQDVGGEAMVISQFTLCGTVSSGNRPSFTDAAPPDRADALYEHFVRSLSEQLDQEIPTGVFGAMMDVHLVNDGPVTLSIEKRND